MEKLILIVKIFEIIWFCFLIDALIWERNHIKEKIIMLILNIIVCTIEMWKIIICNQLNPENISILIVGTINIFFFIFSYSKGKEKVKKS